MKELPLDEAPEGAILARPVVDPNGRELLRQGSELSKVWKDRLRVRKVETVFVEDDPERESGGSSPAVGDAAGPAGARPDTDAMMRTRDLVETRLKAITADVEDWQVAEKLRNVALEYFRRRDWQLED